MALPAFLKPAPGGVYVAVKLQPRASSNALAEVVGAELKVKVTAPPVDAAANEALRRLLAEVLGCPRGAVQLVRGATSRHKVILVSGLTAEEAAPRLHP